MQKQESSRSRAASAAGMPGGLLTRQQRGLLRTALGGRPVRIQRSRQFPSAMPLEGERGREEFGLAGAKSVLYVFEGYAGSFPPAMILTVTNGELKDVTRNSEFAAYNQAVYKAQSEACGMAAGERPAACAGLAGTAAILGVLPETLHYIDFAGARGNATAEPIKICEDRECRRSKEFTDYREALLHALAVWGYRVEQADPKFAGFMKKLVGRRFGGEQGSEKSCELGATAISETQSLLGLPMFEIAEYEQGCAASNGVVIGSSVVFRTVCQGEGDPQWLERRIYSLEGSSLYEGGFNEASALDSHVVEMKECQP